MTSHKPATPRLPLRVARRGGKTIEIANAHGGTIAILDERLADRGEYLVHAANAYPKLIEALKMANQNAKKVWADQLEALLRSLGEL